MATVYTPPGVSVTEIVDPSISPLLAVPAAVCLVGRAAGSIQRTDIITLSGTTAVDIPGVPEDATMTSTSVTSVTDALTPGNAPEGYDSDDDYDFQAGAHTIARRTGGAMPDPTTVYVTYSYTPADYFQPIRLDSPSDIAARFGDAYNDTGTAINSDLTYAATLAIENGARDIVLQPLFYDNNGVKAQPTDSQAANAANWADNFIALRDIEDINVIVVVNGQSNANVGDADQLAIIEALQDHIQFQKTQGQLIMGIVGEDSSASNAVGEPDTLQAHADTVTARYGGDLSQNIIFVAPSKFTRALPSSGADLAIGGQYAASAIGGMLASRSVSQSLTRKAISGFTSVAVARTKGQRNEDASHGLCVIEQKGNIVRVRHGVTLDTTATIRREISIVRAKHRVMESIRSTMDEQIIGQVIADGEAPLIVRSAAIGVLDGLRSNGDIVDFADPQARTKQLDPTIIELRFSYRPAFPVNFIEVTFSLDLTSQDVTIEGQTTETDTGI